VKLNEATIDHLDHLASYSSSLGVPISSYLDLTNFSGAFLSIESVMEEGESLKKEIASSIVHHFTLWTR